MNKILLVEDDVDLLELVKSGLAKKGYKVKATSTCKDGLDIFYQFLPDLVILDINVGDEDGMDMCRQIKAQAEFQHIPVIMISANEIRLQSYKEFGATDIIKKPFTISDLLLVINKYLPTDKNPASLES